MTQLVELNKNADMFAKSNVDVIAVFREEKEGVSGLEKIKKKTNTKFSLALDMNAKKTAQYSSGRREFDSYVVDGSGTIQAVISGDLRNRAKSKELLAVVKKINDSAGSSSKMAAKDSMKSGAAAVERAVLDYVEAIYDMKPENIERSVHPNLAKFGFGMNKSTSKFGAGKVMTYDQLLKLSGEYNKNGRIPKDAPKEVKVFEVSEMIATAKLKAAWGTDFFHLVKQDGQWKILQIVWQAEMKAEKK